MTQSLIVRTGPILKQSTVTRYRLQEGEGGGEGEVGLEGAVVSRVCRGGDEWSPSSLRKQMGAGGCCSESLASCTCANRDLI